MTTQVQRLAAVVIVCLSLPNVGSVVSANNSDEWSPGPTSWIGDLEPISEAEWNYDRAAHLLERAGFSGTPTEIRKLASLTPEAAVRSLVNYDTINNDHLMP